jgi:hypothetical protein
MLLPISYSQQPSFGINLNSPKLKFKPADFFVKIRGYGTQADWADEIIKTADTATTLIRKNTSAENVLKLITAGVRNANKLTLDLGKRERTGILRTIREGWNGVEDNEILTAYEKGRYSKYQERLDATIKKPLNCPLNHMGMSRCTKYQDILHGRAKDINFSLNYVFGLSKKIIPKYIKTEATSKDLGEINDAIAEIRWVLAHATPWQRGSDAISNVFMRAIYKAIGVKSFPIKRGISLDLEAYCTELKDYKENFTSYFDKEPVIID